MTDELKSLIEDAAKLLGFIGIVDWCGSTPVAAYADGHLCGFNPCDPERGDLRKVAEAAELDISFCGSFVETPYHIGLWKFAKNNYESLVLAVLRAASAVLKARGE